MTDTPSRTPRTDSLHARLLRISEGPEWIAGRDYVEMRKHAEAIESDLTALRTENEGLRQHISDMETRHAAVMMHTQSVVDDCEGLREKLARAEHESDVFLDDIERIGNKLETAERKRKAAVAAMAGFKKAADAVALWLRACLDCKHWQWDGDQKEIADNVYAEFKALLTPSLEEGERIVLGNQRYEKVRKLNAAQFLEIYRQNIEKNIPFDDLIDAQRGE